MQTAIEAFIAADAWGHFDGSDYPKELYAAGWPKDVRPYQARLSVALELGSAGSTSATCKAGSDIRAD